MNLRQCLENLKNDINNGGPEDDTFPVNCYIVMVHEVHRKLRQGIGDQQEVDTANEYLNLCSRSRSDGLRAVAED